MIKMLRESAKKTVKAVKQTIKWAIKAIKAIIVGTKALIAFLIAGGWVVVLIITIICIIGMLASSIFGIFFTSEDIGESSKPMNVVIQDINKEFMLKINEIQNNNSYDEYAILGKRTEWKDILAIYTVKVNSNDTDVIVLNDEKTELLKSIFWEMNNLSSEKTTRTETKITGGLTTGIGTETITINILNIKIENKTALEMADIYNFNSEQRKQLNELLSDEYSKMWNAVIYGSNIGNGDIVAVAFSQLGNIGGQPYWSWYGFNSRVEWCATFVSWCANELGYIESGVIPKFAGVDSEGIPFFKACALWQDRGYIPKPGDIIFFDWSDDGRDGRGDHVGIVEYVLDGKVHTIEGNSSDECRQKEYDLNSLDILGYGTPMY